MVQPNTEARPRRSRTRHAEEQAPLVESHLSVANDVIMDGTEETITGLCCTKTLRLQVAAFPAAGIDGPAAFLGSEAPDKGRKIQILSCQSQPQIQSQPQPQPRSQPQSPSQTPAAAAEEPERDGDTETLLEPKTDIHELLQKQGESCQTSTQTIWNICANPFY